MLFIKAFIIGFGATLGLGVAIGLSIVTLALLADILGRTKK